MLHHRQMIRRTRRFLASAGVLGALAGCPQCTPEAVGEDVARLTVRNVHAMMLLLEDDDTCGFASSAVRAGARIEGSAGSDGSVTYTVEDCTVELGGGRDILEDCNGVTLRGFGRVILSATRTVRGTVTGNAEDPVIPASADAVTVTIQEARLDDFRVTRSDNEDSLRMIEGTLSAEASPRQAVAEGSGLCTVSTPNIAFRNIRYEDAQVRVFEEDREYEADIEESDIRAQLGRGATQENTVAGSMTVYGADVDVAGDDVLEDDYNRQEFIAGYACQSAIAEPVSFDCIDLETATADATARLGLIAFDALTGVLEADTSCGFSSTTAAATAQAVGAPGTEGTITTTLNSCALEFGQLRTLPPDCTGRSVTLSGAVLVSGTRVVRGLVTGDPDAPVVPLTSQPATYTLNLTFVDLGIGTTDDDNALLVHSGTARGVVSPMFYVGSATGTCSVATPNMDFTDVDWRGVELTLTADVGTFDIEVEQSDLSGTRGITAAGTNRLEGTITIGGDRVSVDAENRGFDPSFNATDFAASWQCQASLATPLSSACRDAARAELGNQAAAQTVVTLGIAREAIERDAACGFSSADVAADVVLEPQADGLVAATYTLPVDGCAITAAVPASLFVDCLGDTTTVVGSLSARGTKTVIGAPTGDPAAPVLPLSTSAVRYALDFTFADLTFQKAGEPFGLTVHSGGVSAVMSPRLAQSPATGACTIATPIAAYEDVTWTDADVTLASSGTGAAAITIVSSAIDAQAGRGVDAVNTLEGTVTLLGDALALDGPLDPEFDPDVFALTWACAANGSPVLVDDATCALAAVE